MINMYFELFFLFKSLAIKEEIFANKVLRVQSELVRIFIEISTFTTPNWKLSSSKKKELNQIFVAPKMDSESVKKLARLLLTYTSRDKTSNFGRCVEGRYQGAYKAGGTRWNVLPRNHPLKPIKMQRNLCIMLLIQHCGRNSATRSSGPPLGSVSPLLTDRGSTNF